MGKIARMARTWGREGGGIYLSEVAREMALLYQFYLWWDLARGRYIIS